MTLDQGKLRAGLLVLCVAVASSAGCGDDSDDNAGSSCQSVDECYANVSEDLMGGDALCLDRTEAGYCTHLCSQDSDCCAVDGECRSGAAQVCAPFESTGQMMCFLSCEGEDVSGAGYDDPDLYCGELAARDFTCRSTGGGAQNRKVCFPPG